MTGNERAKAVEELREVAATVGDLVDTAWQALRDAGEFSLDGPEALGMLASLREAANALEGVGDALDKALQPFEEGGAYELREDED